MSTSVELRFDIDGDCHCGKPFPIGENPSTCNHRLLCQWGEIEHPNPRPDRGELGHLMLATQRYVSCLIECGPVLCLDGRRYSATVDGERTFIHLDLNTQHYTWELFEAHFAAEDDYSGPDLFVGRWPD